jgi:acetylornithine deacetylase/succinyl-diaminopimelate desuccinylase-like protein
MYTNLRERSVACRKDLLAFLQLLVRTRSFSFKEETAAGIVQDLLEDLSYDLVFRDEVGNVVGLLTGTEEGPAVLLNSHMDTRHPDAEDAGEDGLFSGRVENGRLAGLGAAACKGGLAAQVFAAHLLDRSHLPLCGTIVVAATVAQEEGNGAGLRHLMTETLPKLGIAPALAILGEPTSLAACNGGDGWVDVDVPISGREPAIARRAAAAVREALSPATRYEIPADDRALARPAGHTQEDRSGKSEELIRLRLPVGPGEDAADAVGLVKRLARAAADSIGDVAADARVHTERRRFYTGRPVEFLCWNNAWATDPSLPLVRRALDALTAAGCPDTAVRSWKPTDLRMGSAGALVANGGHVPTLCFGPGDEDRAHTSEESVEIEKLVDAVFGTAVLVHGAIGNPAAHADPADGAQSAPHRAPTARSGG